MNELCEQSSRKPKYPRAMTRTAPRVITATLFCLSVLFLFSTPARAQHGDYILGTVGLEGGSQAPEGLYYSNVWSYYHTSSSDFVATSSLTCGPLDRDCLRLNAGGSGNLDLFVDQNIFVWTTPLQILGAHYGLLLDIPFAYADASGAAALEPVLTTEHGAFSGTARSTSGGSIKGNISNIYFEPINLGWHFKYLDATVSSGVIAPTGTYNPKARLNIGPGNAAGLFGLGMVAYPDEAHTWSLSIYSHYEIYASQMNRPYTLGDEVPFEWGAGKTFNFKNEIFKQLVLGAVGYAQWQTTDNAIDVHPTSQAGISILNTLEDTKAQIYAAGPAVNLTTAYGLFALRYYEEFGAAATPSGRQLMFNFAF